MQLSTIVLAALSMGSAIASPVVSGFAPFNTAASKAAEIKVLVGQEAGHIKSWASGSPNANTVANVQKSLLTIGRSVNSLVDPAIALGSAGANSLSKEQIASVKQFQNDIKDIFVHIDTVGKSISNGNFGNDAISKVNPQLQWVLASPPTIAAPIIAFVDVAAPQYATYSYWYPSIISIQALINIFINIKLNLGLGIFIGL